jgi:hypothetical protein
VQGQVSTGFLKSLYSKEERISKIEEYHRQISALVDAFKVNLFIKGAIQAPSVDNARYLHY